MPTPQPTFTHRLATLLSLIGHPLILLPLVVALVSLGQGQGQLDGAGWAGLGVTVAAALMVAAYSGFRVWRGAWRDADASEVGERRDLNGKLLLLFVVLAGGQWWRFGWSATVLALVLAGGMIAVALGLQRWLKLSLHAAFVAFAAWIVARHGAGAAWVLGGAMAAFAWAVAWSRWRLQRHTVRDVVVGNVVGNLAGWIWISG